MDTSFTVNKASYLPKVTSLFANTDLPVFSKVTNNLGIHHTYQENSFIDFKKQRLIPYQVSDRSRAMVVGDLDTDGDDDIFVGGSKARSAIVYIQEETGFFSKPDTSMAQDAVSEDVSVLLEDLDGENGKDLVVVSGGGEFSKKINRC